MKIKENLADNHAHNNLRHFDVSPNFSFTKSEVKGNCWLQIWHIRVASPFIVQVKIQDLRKLGKIIKISKIYSAIA